MGLKEILMKQVLKSKLKDVPEAQRDMLLAVVEKNPEFFEKIAKEIEAGTKAGRDQNTVAMEVMMRYKDELQKLMSR